MSIQTQACEAVRRAESEVRDLLEMAAADGDYDTVKDLADLAQALRRLAKASTPLPNRVTPLGARRDGRGSKSSRSGRKKLDGQRNSRADTGYPHFRVDGDQLVKTGWSKSANAEYEHRATREVVDLLADALQRAGQGRRRFTMEEILPLMGRDGTSEIPSYQAYLVLAWLRRAGLVQQHGRQGYSIPSPNSLATRISEEWEGAVSRI